MSLKLWYQSSLRNQIVVWIVAINVVAIFLIFSGALRIASNAVEKNIVAQLEREHVIEAERIELYFNRLVIELEFFVRGQSGILSRPGVTNPNQANTLDVALKNYPLVQQDFDFFYLIDHQQKIQAATGGLADWLPQSSGLVQRARTQNRMMAGLYPSTDGFSLQIAMPLENQAVLLASQPIDRLVARSFQGRRDLDAWSLADRTGQVISATTVNAKLDQSLLQELFSGPSSPDLPPTANSALPWRTIQGTLRLRPPLEDLGLRLVLTERTNWTQTVLLELAIPFVLMGLLVATLVLMIVALIGKKLTTPLKELTAYTLTINDSAQALASENASLMHLTQRTDEVGRLSTQFAQLIYRLRTRYLGLEQRVAERNAQLEAIFQLSPDGFMEINAANRIAFINPAFENLFGFSALELVGVPLSQWLAKLQPHTNEHSLSQLQTLFAVQDRLGFLELNSPLKRSITILTKANQGGGTVVYVRDVTQEAELQELRSAFMSTAAHELRTPISNILGYAQLLMRRLKTDGVAKPQGLEEMASVIERQSKNMADLVNDLLDLTRLEHQLARGFQLQETSLVGYLRTTVSQFDTGGDTRNLVTYIDDHLPLVRLHPESFKRVIINVLSNALKYSPLGSPIAIRTFVDTIGDCPAVCITIEDHGYGIAAQDLEHVFERFYRSTLHSNTQGTGLGLAIVQEIMEAHGGEVQIASVEGQGTTVTLRFPVATSANLAA